MVPVSAITFMWYVCENPREGNAFKSAPLFFSEIVLGEEFCGIHLLYVCCAHLVQVDLALGHVAAIKRVVGEPGCVEYNLGSGSGCSVLEVIKAVEVACGKEIPYAMAPRRAGDIATCYAGRLLPAKSKRSGRL